MIGYLVGKLKWQQGAEIIIDVSGVGYLLEISNQFHLPAVNEKMEVYVYTYVREDAIKLYGFNTMEERELFTILLSVSGIGPRAGLNIFSSISVNRFIDAILTENIPVLKQISGIGPKTAQRLILELKNKIADLAQTMHLEDVQNLKVDDELYAALESLGYSNSEVEKAAVELELTDEFSLQEKIKLVLQYLGKER